MKMEYRFEEYITVEYGSGTYDIILNKYIYYETGQKVYECYPLGERKDKKEAIEYAMNQSKKHNIKYKGVNL